MTLQYASDTKPDARHVHRPSISKKNQLQKESDELKHPGKK